MISVHHASGLCSSTEYSFDNIHSSKTGTERLCLWAQTPVLLLAEGVKGNQKILGPFLGICCKKSLLIILSFFNGANFDEFIFAILCSGVRTFVPKPVATTLQYIGGAAAILGLVAMASDVEGLYAAVKALVCVVKSNPLASKEMERIKGYQVGEKTDMAVCVCLM